MEFKKLNMKTIILISISVIGVIFIISNVSKLFQHHDEISDQATPMPAVLKNQPSVSAAPVLVQAPRPAVVRPMQTKLQTSDPEDDSESLKDIKDQMDNDRLQQKKIKTLKLELEQTNLQLEEDKAQSEINKLEKENAGVASDSNDQGPNKNPSVSVLYIGGSSAQKEALLSINGSSYTVKSGVKPLPNLEIVSISDSSVTVHFTSPQDMKETFEYKPE